MLEDRRLLANPGLTINILADSIPANAGPGATTGTVTRLNADTSQPLTVSLKSSTPDSVSVPTSVVILAGQTSASFSVESTPGNLTADDHVVTITASAVLNGSFSKDVSFVSSTGLNDYLLTTQADGKLVTAGTYFMQGIGSDFGVQRYNADGTVDTAFHNGTTAIIGLPGRSLTAEGVVVQGDGKVVVGGLFSETSNTTRDIQLARLTVDGRLDDSFGSDGWVTLIPTPGAFNELWDLTLLPDGKILIGGSISNLTTSNDFAVARLNSDGSLDSTFGSGGYATTSFSLGRDRGYGLAVQPDGKILLGGGSVGSDSILSLAVARWTSDGQLDSTFGTGGKVKSDVPGINGFGDIAIQPDGKIVVAGSTANGLALVRYSTTGTLDTSFGAGGIVTQNPGRGSSVVILEGGEIVVGSTTLRAITESCVRGVEEGGVPLVYRKTTNRPKWPRSTPPWISLQPRRSPGQRARSRIR